jgi:benzoyl-CoA reductase subunit C
MTDIPAAKFSTTEIIQRCQELYEDLDFTAAREWKSAEPGRRVIGYMPVYVPCEIIHAAGMLPLGVLGGGDQLEVIHGDAYYQSYICRIPRSTVELGITKRLDFVDGMLFPSICDVIRNLSGMWQLMFPDVYTRYFDVPQNYEDDVGGEYYIHELQELKAGLESVGGRVITDEALRDSITVYNENRRLVRQIYEFRSTRPERAPSSEVYLLMRAGMVLPVDGAFCEQPPLNLIKSIEMAGCYIVDDDYMLVNRWLLDDVSLDGDPLANLALAFLHDSADTAAKYCTSDAEVGKQLLESVDRFDAEGVIFTAASFCDPALLERPMLVDKLSEHDIPYIAFKYAENSGQMQPIREQAGTFADSIKLWS